MNKISSFILAVLLTVALTGCAGMGGFGVSGPSGLTVVAESSRQWTGVAVSRTGRVFVCWPRWSDDVPVSVAELMPDGSMKPYPDERWNSWTPGGRMNDQFICVQSVYIDDEDFLWILDPASPKFEGALEGGPKLIKVELATNRVVRRYYFDEYTAPPSSYLNDVRIDTLNRYAYMTDSGAGALVVLNLATGAARRLLESHPSVKSEDIAVTIDGTPWLRPNGRKPSVHVDGIALDPAREYIYFHALTGRTLYRVQTRLLRDVLMPYDKLGEAVEQVAVTGPVDGMIFTQDWTLYMTALEEHAITRLTSEGRMETALADRRIAWPDSFAIGPDGEIYFTTSQINLGPAPGEPYRLFRFRP